MRDLISIQSFVDAAFGRTLKRDALMFDRIIVNAAFGAELCVYVKDWENVLDTLEWLEEIGLVTIEDLSPYEENLRIEEKEWIHEANPYNDVRYIFQFDSDDRATRGWKARAKIAHVEYLNRVYRAHLLRNTACEPTVLSRLPFLPTTVPSSARTNDLVHIILKKLPIPDEDTPWQDVLAFRSDTDSKNKYLDLRNWMNEIALGNISLDMAEEKLEYLLSQFERHMALHKIKFRNGVFETLVVSSAEVIENLVRLKFSKIAKSIFSLRKAKLDLLKAELTAPGNQVAYVHKSREEFY